MYTDFYSLNEKPFTLSPSSRFLYLGETHKEALALLNYGVLERKGFVLLTGEVGTGKTTIVHALLASLDENAQLVHLSNPILSPREFLDYLARKALGRETAFHSKAEFLIDFETFLRDCLKSGKNFLLIIDEAHKLSFELLEEIRLLSNLETAEDKLINIFLVGQPELRGRLRDPRSEALFQRISIHYHLKPLDEQSVAEYVRTRLGVAGAKVPDKIFPESVIKAIHHYSKGYPREINIIADNVLLLGYVQGKKEITPGLVTECRDYMTLDSSQVEQENEIGEPSETRGATLRSLSNHLYLFAVVFLILGVALGVAIGLVGNKMLDREPDMMPMAKQYDVGAEERLGPVKGSETTDTHPSPQPEKLASIENMGSPQSVTLKETEVPLATEERGADANVKNSEQAPLASDIPQEMNEQPSDFQPQAGQTSWRTVTVKEGDTLTELVLKVYGQGDQTILDLVKEKNPSIENVNLILVGQRLSFPPLSISENQSDSMESGT